MSDATVPPKNATPTSKALEALEIARQWGELPADHLELALKAMQIDDARARDHEYRMTKLKQTHQLFLCGVVAGLVIALAMLTGAMVLGLHHETWLAGLFAGPSVLALASLFVLRRVDAKQAKAVARPLDHFAGSEPAAPEVAGF